MLLNDYYINTRGINPDVIMLHMDAGLLKYNNGYHLLRSKKRTPTGARAGKKYKPCGEHVTRQLDGSPGLPTYRFFTPYIYQGTTDNKEKTLKTLTQAAWGKYKGLKKGYYFHQLDFTQPIYVAEGDIDYLTLYAINPNTIGITGNNIEKLCDDLKVIEYSGIIYLVLDCDEPTNKKIAKLKTKLKQKKYPFIIKDSRHVINQK